MILTFKKKPAIKLLNILFSSVIFRSIIGISPSFQPVFASDSLQYQGSISEIGKIKEYRFTLSGAEKTSTLVANLICGPSSNIFDHVLTIKNPTMTKFDYDSHTPCNHYFSAYIQFSVGEFVNRSWRVLAGGHK